MKEQPIIFALTKQDTAVLKGIAIIGMLCHHLFGCSIDGAEMYNAFELVLGNLGKVCVAMFLFCSGYGLAKGYSTMCDGWLSNVSLWNRIKETLKFLAKRFVKFYAGYWVVFLIFVPITVYIFGRPLSAAYGETVNIPKRLLFDLFAWQGFQSYNITWWFNKLIIIFYLLFPFLYTGCKHISWIMAVVAFVAMFFDEFFISYATFVMLYAFPFVLGIVWCTCENRIGEVLEKKLTWVYVVAVLLGMSCVFCRLDILSIPMLGGCRVDGLFTVSILLIVLLVRPYVPRTSNVIGYIGNQSSIMYLCHTFFLGYLPTNQLFASVNLWGGVKFTILFFMAFGASTLISYLKEITRYNNLVNKIISKI